MRDKILNAIATMRLYNIGSDKREKIVRSIGEDIYKKGTFSIEAMVYSPIHSRLSSVDHDSVLDSIESELMSSTGKWKSYAIRRNFVDHLETDSADAFEILHQLFREVKNHLNQHKKLSSLQSDLILQLRKYQKNKECVQLHEIIIGQMIQILLNLPPSRQDQFALKDTGYSLLFPNDETENINELLERIERCINQLKGHKTIFVDFLINEGGYIFLVR